MPATNLFLPNISEPDCAKSERMTVDKQELLKHLDRNECTSAEDVANAVEKSYSAAAMALMRLVRQHLAARYIDTDTQLYVYEITPKGEARLDYFLAVEADDD